jgi:hypothetical protein
MKALLHILVLLFLIGCSQSSSVQESRKTAIKGSEVPKIERDQEALKQSPINIKESEMQERTELLSAGSAHDRPNPTYVESKDPNVVDLNLQIERFNKEGRRMKFDAFIDYIHQRVARIEYVKQEDAIHCFDEKGMDFLTLKRQQNGRFEGIIEIHYEEVWKPEGHVWGSILAKLFLPQETFEQVAPSAPQ